VRVVIRTALATAILLGAIQSPLATSDSATAVAPAAAGKCTNVGAKRLIGGVRHVCVLVGKNRMWIPDGGATTTLPPNTTTTSTTTTSTTTTTVPTPDKIRFGSDLTGMKLQGINLAGKDLSTLRAPHADFSGADFSGAFVMSVNFASAVLKGANLSRAEGGWLYLNGANLEGANLSNAILHSSNFDAHGFNQIIRVNLRDTNLTGATLRYSTFESADLTRAVARNANFTSANFQKAILQKADLTNAEFRSADLSEADFTGATVGSDWRNYFQGARFSQTTWVDGKVYSAMPATP
jgi:uncharacterized protein YjbI with pentapeptide repeats